MSAFFMEVLCSTEAPLITGQKECFWNRKSWCPWFALLRPSSDSC